MERESRLIKRTPLKRRPAAQVDPEPGLALEPDLLSRDLLAFQSGHAAPEGVAHLQRAIGNRRVLQLLKQQENDPGGEAGRVAALSAPIVQRSPAPAKKSSIPADAPAWAAEDKPTIRAMQKELRRLGLYGLGLDGDYGPGTDSGLVEAFGGDSFRTLAKEDVLSLLQAAKPTAVGKKGQRTLRYGEMFKDGVLDITLGVGHEEGAEAKGDPLLWQRSLEEVLGARGFVVDPDEAVKLYKQANRAVTKADYGVFYVKKNAINYQPPIGPLRQVSAIVRMVSGAGSGHGKEAAEAFEEGMAESDVAFYTGHGRYGSGMDFDRNFDKFTLKDADGSITEEIKEYQILERRMRDEGNPHGRGAWGQFMWRVNHSRIEVAFSNEANIYMNKKDRHSNEFGAKLIYWALEKTGKPLATGAEGDLAGLAEAHPEKKYRVTVFDGCNTRDYLDSYRGTPGYDTKSTETIATKRPVYLMDLAGTVAAFLDSIMAQQSAKEVIQGMEAQQEHDPGDPGSMGSAFTNQGSKYDPTVK